MKYLHRVLMSAFAGDHIWRSEWLNEFHVEVDHSSEILVRVSNKDKSRTPWYPTEADFFTKDWHDNYNSTNENPLIIPGTWPWVFENLLDGKKVMLLEQNEIVKISVKKVLYPFVGRVIIRHYLNGNVAIFRPEPHHFAAVKWTLC